MSYFQIFLLVMSCSPLFSADKGEWETYGRDFGGQRFSPLDTINKATVTELKLAWIFRTGDAYKPPNGRPTAFEATPIYVDGTLFLATPLGRAIALDPVTGHQKWAYDSHVPKDAGYGDFATRGVATWVAAGQKRRIYLATIDAHLIALDSESGQHARTSETTES